jgi:predicted amino acid racemase
MQTLSTAASRLRAAGYTITQVNAPGTNTSETIALVARHGATHVEPGNALHGTTPMQAFDPDSPERPAVVYVSEVSHIDDDDAYVFAAGYYVDKVLGDYEVRALVGRDDSLLERSVHVDTAPDGAIHYYCILRSARSAGIQVGDTVVFCFRPQTFVTRGRTQAIGGVESGTLDVRPPYNEEACQTDGIA